LLLNDELGSWRRPFLVIGAAGLSWVVLWLASVRSTDLRLPADDMNPTKDVSHGLQEEESSFWRILFSARFAVVVCVSVSVNLCWHMLRVCLPLFLQDDIGLAFVVWLPLASWVVLWRFWPGSRHSSQQPDGEVTT
jgi:hypothetical protein